MIQRYSQFWLLRKGMGIVYPTHFVYNISRKMLLMLHSINWPNFIVSLKTYGDIGQHMHCNCLFVKNLNILRTKRAFKVKKAFFIIYKGLSVAKNCLRPYSTSLNLKSVKCTRALTIAVAL